MDLINLSSGILVLYLRSQVEYIDMYMLVSPTMTRQCIY